MTTTVAPPMTADVWTVLDALRRRIAELQLQVQDCDRPRRKRRSLAARQLRTKRRKAMVNEIHRLRKESSQLIKRGRLQMSPETAIATMRAESAAAVRV